MTAFNRDGSLDIDANVRIAKWLASFDEVKSLVILGHAGEGTFLTTDERLELIRAYKDAVDIPIIAGITGEGTKVAAEEAKRSLDAGATGALVYPNHGWLRFGFQKGAPQDRYKAIYEEGGLQTILFQYPAATKANYDLDTQLEIAAQEGCVATKNGVRDMKRWYVEIPALKEAQPELQVLSCHDEWLLPTMFDVDGLLVGYGNIAPELLIDLIHAGKAQDYTAAREIFERLLPVTQAVYHRGSHMEGTVALKIGLRHRGLLDHATIREPLKDLGDAAEREIEAAFEAAGIGRVDLAIAAE
ncbi:dihydrodipicolinate synthase family protein [Vannielia sp. SX4]|uniref:dihydrodipicolinate synthase family protein n=1 Tax=Vannielia sp. SX4 TaxID=3463852 RepID=UPI0040595693